MRWGRFQPWAAPAALGTGTVATGGMWLPWFQSGSAGRNSFAAFRAAQVLGIEALTPLRVFWFLLPVVLVTAAVVLFFGGARASTAVLGALGLVLLVSGAFALFWIGPHPGSVAAATAGLCTTVIAVFGLGVGPEPTNDVPREAARRRS